MLISNYKYNLRMNLNFAPFFAISGAQVDLRRINIDILLIANTCFHFYFMSFFAFFSFFLLLLFSFFPFFCYGRCSCHSV